jgi:hypothetical protein
VKTEGKRRIVKARNRRKTNIKLDFIQLVVQVWTEVKWLKMECLGRH